ncbi:MAG: TMEM165/GDT1 family protein [Halarchaeum sp.]
MGVPVAASGVTGLDQYHHYGPALAAFITNFLATFGDKGQLAVITLATVYDSTRVFLGAVSAFAVWNAVEVTVGTAIFGVVPAGAMGAITGALFVAFGAWACYQAYDLYAHTDGDADGEDVLTSVLPDGVYERVRGSGAFAVAFATIAVAEVGDKTQLLTINLAAAFPASPWQVFLGAWCGLALRTGLDAFVGEAAERHLPTVAIQAAAAVVFVAVGLFEWDVLSGPAVVACAALAVAGVAASAGYRRWRASAGV